MFRTEMIQKLNKGYPPLLLSALKWVDIYLDRGIDEAENNCACCYVADSDCTKCDLYKYLIKKYYDDFELEIPDETPSCTKFFPHSIEWILHHKTMHNDDNKTISKLRHTHKEPKCPKCNKIAKAIADEIFEAFYNTKW